MKAVLDIGPGVFTEIEGEYFLASERIKAGTVITKGAALPVSCMFDIYFAIVADQRVGFIFASRFEVHNGGAYLMTYLRNKGAATESETLVKDEHLVVYNYPNKGTLAVSPVVNAEIENIFQEQ